MRVCPECNQFYEDDQLICPKDGADTQVAAESLADRLLGKVLDDRWIIDKTLGEGGMGAVFKGRQKSLDRPVAIKVLKPNLAVSATLANRFMREARVLSALRHPNVVTIFDFGRDETLGMLYLVMELIDGDPLDEWLFRTQSISVKETIEIAIQITRALHAAHAKKTVHRDLKPQNIMVSPVAGGFHIKVLDFGLAKVAASDTSHDLTHTGDIHGTPHYMSPEQASGMEVGPATDLYALGVILYEIIAGSPPFDAPTPMAVLLHHIHNPPPPIAPRWSLTDPVDDALVALTRHLLEKEISKRPSSAEKVLELLNSIAAHAGFLALAPTAEMPVLRKDTRPIRHNETALVGVGDEAAALEDERVTLPRNSSSETLLLDSKGVPDSFEAGASRAEAEPASTHENTQPTVAQRRMTPTTIALVSLALATVFGGLLWANFAANSERPGNVVKITNEPRPIDESSRAVEDSIEAAKTSIEAAVQTTDRLEESGEPRKGAGTSPKVSTSPPEISDEDDAKEVAIQDTVKRSKKTTKAESDRSRPSKEDEAEKPKVYKTIPPSDETKLQEERTPPQPEAEVTSTPGDSREADIDEALQKQLEEMRRRR